MQYFAKIVSPKGSILDENRWLFLQDAPSLMADTVLNTPLECENIGEKSANFLERPGQLPSKCL